MKVSPESGSVVLRVATADPPVMFSLKVDAESERLVGSSLISFTFKVNDF